MGGIEGSEWCEGWTVFCPRALGATSLILAGFPSGTCISVWGWDSRISLGCHSWRAENVHPTRYSWHKYSAFLPNWDKLGQLQIVPSRAPVWVRVKVTRPADWHLCVALFSFSPNFLLINHFYVNSGLTMCYRWTQSRTCSSLFEIFERSSALNL